jgi:hypothetical protein
MSWVLYASLLSLTEIGMPIKVACVSLPARDFISLHPRDPTSATLQKQHTISRFHK